MNYNRTEEAKEAQSKLEDAAWLSERMIVLVIELKEIKEPRRAAFIRGCLYAAMKQHGRILNITQVPADEYDSE